MSDTKIEYRVRPINRFVVTRFCQDGSAGSVEEKGTFDNANIAYEVAYALCKNDHDRLGYPPSDERIQYPRHPNQIGAVNSE